MVTSAPERTVPDVSFLLAHASHVLATRMTAAFAELGMTPRGFCVLSRALRGGQTQAELAKLADLDKTTMVVTLDDLEEQGYAERRPSPSDRRARIVSRSLTGCIARSWTRCRRPSARPWSVRSPGWSAGIWPSPWRASGRSGGRGRAGISPAEDCL
jgi:DNA-binding MarR family transcriptional regulator